MNRTPAAAPTVVRTGTGLVRVVRQDDADGVREFICGLSPLSQYFRFFASAAPPSTGLLRALCGSTGADVLLVIDGDGRIIGHGMGADVPDGGGGLAANIGLVIADRWQDRGLGTMLLRTLVGRAARRGVTSLVMDVLPANSRMLAIINSHWPDAPKERTPDAMVFRPRIGQQQAASAYVQVPALIGLGSEPDPVIA